MIQRRRTFIEPLETRIAPAFTTFSLLGLNGSNGFTVTGGVDTQAFQPGYTAIANGGDVNGDGYDDLLIGSDTGHADSSPGNQGLVAVIWGRPGGFPVNINLDALGTSGVLIGGKGGGFGKAVASAGDVNGDGFDDIVIGASSTGSGGDGEVYVFFGGAALPATQNIGGLNGTNGFKIAGDDRSFPGGVGTVVGGRVLLGEGQGGDYNGDGFADILVGAPDVSAFVQTGGGGVFVIFGHTGAFTPTLSTASLNGTNGFLIASSKSNDRIGASVGFIGDVNQDGRDDIGVGNLPNGGTLHTTVVFGQTTSTAVLNVVTLTAAQGFDIPTVTTPHQYFVGSKVVLRDIDGDGKLDLGIPFNFGFPEKTEGFVWAKNSGSGFSTNPFTKPQTLTRQVLVGPDGRNPYGNGGISDLFYDPGDFDGDGVTDYLAYLDGAGTLAIYNGTQKSGLYTLNSTKGSGTYLFRPDITPTLHNYGTFNFIGDINGDGLDDAAWIPPSGQVAEKAFIVLGTNLSGSADGKTFTYTDVDGDIVTVKTTKGKLDPAEFLLASAPGAVLGGKQLQLLNLSLGNGVADYDNTGATITITAKPGPLGGDGLVNVGAIDAHGIDLGKVTVSGDLGQIDAGTGSTKAAITTLTVNSLGRYGLTTQGVGGSLESDINGPLTKLAVTTDIDGAFVNVTGVNGKIGTLTVSHSLIGGATANSGSVIAAGSIGTTTIGGNLLGGVGAGSASITGASIGKVKVSGSIFGGTGANSATLISGSTIGAVTISHDVHGGTASGGISAMGAISSVKITGNLIGGAGDFSGSVKSLGAIGNVTISGNLDGGTSGRTGVFAGGSLGAVTVGGSVFGSAANPAFISSGKDAKSSTLKSLTVTGSVHFARVIAGFDTAGAALVADAQIGKVVVKGDWIGGSISAGVNPGMDGKFGTPDDSVIAGVSASIFTKIASIAITGEARGTDGGSDRYAFTAEQIGSLKVGKATFPLTKTTASNTAEDEFNVGATFDLRVRELDAAAPLPPVAFTPFIGGERVLSADGKTFTFSDVDGDLVTIKTDKGKFDLANFEFPDATSGQLRRINLANDADFNGKKASLTITAARSSANGGDGFVDIGAIDFTGVDLTKVTTPGDVGVIAGGSSSATVAAVGTLTLHSLGGRGSSTGATSPQSNLFGKVSKLTVATDVNGVGFAVFGTLAKATIGGSIIGLGNAAALSATVDLSRVTIKGDVRGGTVEDSACVAALGKIGNITVSGSLYGGSGPDTGNIESPTSIGKVTIGRSVYGGSGVQSGSITAGGNIASVKISGDLIGGSGDYAGSIFADLGMSDLGTIGAITISGSLFGGSNTLTGIFSGSTLSSIKITGDVRGAATANVHIVAEGLAAPASSSKANAIKSLTVSGDVSRLDLLAGYSTSLSPLRSDVQIGAVVAKGSWSRSNVLAGVKPDGTAIADVNAAIVSRIASISVTAGISGAPGAVPGSTFLFSAQQIGSLKVGSTKFAFSSKTAVQDSFAVGPTPDVHAVEVA